MNPPIDLVQNADGAWVLPGSRAVQDQELKYVSPSSLQKFADCPRRWWFEYVCGISLGETVAMKRGKEIHSMIEHYLTTGEDQLERTARAALPYIPEPGPDLLVEHRIPSTGFLSLAGVPVTGYIDLTYDRDEYIDDTGLRYSAAVREFVVKDWKTTRDLKWVRNPDGIQMLIYSMYGFRLGDLFDVHYERARAQLVFIRTRGAPASVQTTKLYWREEAEEDFNILGLNVDLMSALVSVTDQDHVPANTDHCDAYGGCPHLSYCTAGQKAVVQLYTEGDTSMSLIGKKKRKQMQMLEYEEVINRIESAGMGFPPLSGEAAKVYCKVKGISDSAAAWGGEGELADGCERITDPDDFGLLAEELGVGVASALPPDAPLPDPEAHVPEDEDPEAKPGKPSSSEGATPSETPGAASDVAEALATLRASKCGKKARLEAVEVLAGALEGKKTGYSSSLAAADIVLREVATAYKKLMEFAS